MSKLTNAITVHLSDEDDNAITVLSDLEDVSKSEYLRNLIVEHLLLERQRHIAMAKAFSTENSQIDANAGNWGK